MNRQTKERPRSPALDERRCPPCAPVEAHGDELQRLREELVAAYEEMNARVEDAATASEFRTLCRQVLDVDDLLVVVPKNAVGFKRLHQLDGHGVGALRHGPVARLRVVP